MLVESPVMLEKVLLVFKDKSDLSYLTGSMGLAYLSTFTIEI